MKSSATKAKYIIDTKVDVYKVYGKEPKSSKYIDKFRLISGILPDFDIDQMDDDQAEWVISHIPGGNGTINKMSQAKLLREAIINAANGNPMYIDDNEFNRFDILNAIEHVNEEVNAENEYLDVDADGKISEEDIDLLRKALEVELAFNLYVKDNGVKDDTKVEELVKVSIQPSSEDDVVLMNDIKTTKLLVEKNTSVRYVVESANGAFHKEGTIEVSDQDIKDIKVVFSEQYLYVGKLSDGYPESIDESNSISIDNFDNIHIYKENETDEDIDWIFAVTNKYTYDIFDSEELFSQNDFFEIVDNNYLNEYTLYKSLTKNRSIDILLKK